MGLTVDIDTVDLRSKIDSNEYSTDVGGPEDGRRWRGSVCVRLVK